MDHVSILEPPRRSRRAPATLLRCAIALGALTPLAGCFTSAAENHSRGDVPQADSGGDAGGGVATLVIAGDTSIAAPSTAYGQNYWSWVSSYGDQVHQVQSAAADLGVTLLRAGGHNNDDNTPEPFNDAEIDRFVAYARSLGAEPVLQVPLLPDATAIRPTPAIAAAMVTYANVTQGYGIKYWEIGNEPDLYSDQGDLPAGYSAASYCTDFSAFADAMRQVDPTIKILGPELSYKYVSGNDWLTPFLTACGSKVDIVSVHRYPFAAASCTIANAMNDSVQFRATVRRLRSLLDAHGLAAFPLAITEANFTYQGDPTLQTQPAALGTFYAGMWVADTLGVALEENLWSLAFWSIDEGFDTGFFTSDTFLPRPAAYAYELVAKHFGPTILHASLVPAGLAAHASRDDVAHKTIVLLLNQTAAESSPILGVAGPALTLPNRMVTLPPYSLTLMELPDNGSAPQVWLYTKEMADQSLPPQLQ